MLFSIPSSIQASKMYSAGVKPVPSSRVEKRRIPMVLLSAEGVIILRPPSSKGCNKKHKSQYWKDVVGKKKHSYNGKMQHSFTTVSLNTLSKYSTIYCLVHIKKHKEMLYLSGVMSFKLSVGC